MYFYSHTDDSISIISSFLGSLRCMNCLQQLQLQQTNQSASFGPFDGQVLILNEDGKGFTLLANPQAMRLKKAGLIGDDKKFTRQPTQEELDAALESGPGLFDRFFGGGGGGDGSES
jgi:hypothetical protein